MDQVQLASPDLRRQMRKLPMDTCGVQGQALPTSCAERSLPCVPHGKAKTDVSGTALTMKKVLFYFLIFSTLFSVYSLSVAVWAFILLQDSSNEISGVLRNWKIPPIQTMKLIEGQDCGVGNELAGTSWTKYDEKVAKDLSETLGGVGWKKYNGTMEQACVCRMNSGIGDVTGGMCANDANYYCEDKESDQKATEITVWRGSTLCVKRAAPKDDI